MQRGASDPLHRKLCKSRPRGSAYRAIVGEVLAPLALLLATAEPQANVIVVTLDGAKEPGICSHLLAAYPHVVILPGFMIRHAAALAYGTLSCGATRGQPTPRKSLGLGATPSYRLTIGA